MATVEQKIRCEHRARELLVEQGLPLPTLIEYGYTCIRFIWPESRLALRIDIDDEATTDHVVLIDTPHPSQPSLANDDDDDPLSLVGIALSPT
ncbi:MAG: hypothetical protein NVS3B18_16920 [Candidatus Dormibacteria bacterium]